jgi:hypothetical protein
MTPLLSLVLYVAILVSVIVVMSWALPLVNAEQYKFNMTKELEDEERVLQICIETTIKLEFCDSRYGALDKPYGEAIK